MSVGDPRRPAGRTPSGSGGRWRRVAASALAAAGLLAWPAIGHGQITLDGSLGPGGPLGGPAYAIDAAVGQVKGASLFHSFGVFSLHAGESATFTGPAFIRTILSRVTGGQASLIDGLIDARSSMPHATFYFLNPSGVIIGPNAALDVGGSVHVSTADYVRLADGSKFFASLAQASVLSVAEPVAFGFLGPAPAPVSVEGSFLSVDAGQTLSIVGGDVAVRGATLLAPGGRVQIASAAGRGEVGVADLGIAVASRLGAVEISGGSLVDVSGDPGGTVVIRGGRLVIDAATILAASLGDTDGAPTGIDVWAQESVVLSSGAGLLTQVLAGGRGGDARIGAGGGPGEGTIHLSGSSVILTTTEGSGRGGDVRLTAGRITVEDAGIATASQFGEGVGGDVTLEGGVIALLRGGLIQSVNQSAATGRGGSITLRATEGILFSGQSEFGGSSGLLSSTDTAGDGGGIFLSAPWLTMESGAAITSVASIGEGPGGTGGAIAIDVGRLSLTGGAAINSVYTAATPGVPGQAGLVKVTVAGEADIAGAGSGIFSVAFGAPPADIEVEVGTLRLTDGALIQGGSFAGDSEGGDVTVRARESILIAGRAGISSQALSLEVGRIEVSAPRLTIDGGFINTGTLGVGRAGDITIDVGTLAITGGGQIASSSIFTASGAGGTVTIRATEAVAISGGSPDGQPVLPEPFRGFIEDTASGVFSTASSDNPVAGPAGSILVSTPWLAVTDGARISVASTGPGAAGSIVLSASTFTLSGGARIDSSTLGTGRGGDIRITGGQIGLRDRATISARSTGPAEALAGDVTIAFASELVLEGGSAITTDSLLADGGSISITSTGSLMRLVASEITTSVRSGLGSGGNITLGSELHPLDFVILDRSRIRADAFGGPGGNIRIFADTYLTAGSVVSASSALSEPGTIDIEARVTDLSGALTPLPETVLQAAALLRASCAARLTDGMASSLVVGSRAGTPPEPDGLLASPLIVGEADAAGLRETDPSSPQPLLGIGRIALDTRCGR